MRPALRAKRPKPAASVPDFLGRPFDSSAALHHALIPPVKSAANRRQTAEVSGFSGPCVVEPARHASGFSGPVEPTPAHEVSGFSGVWALAS
jgi:hypothetical protein